MGWRVYGWRGLLLVLALGCGGCGSDVLKITVDPAGPVPTPEAAREAVRRYRAARGGRLPTGGVEITLADGVHFLRGPLALTAEDSGTAEAPVVWRAANRGRACLSGMRTISAWRPVQSSSVASLLPEQARAHVLEADLPWDGEIPDFGGGSEACYAKRLNYPLWLYQDGQRLPLARYPDRVTEPERMGENYILTGPTVGGDEQESTYGQRSTSGVFRCDEPRMAQWAKEPDVWVYGLFLHEYADMKMAVTNIDLTARTMALDTRWYSRGFRRHAPFYVFNVFSALDRPGEWVMDRANRKVYLWPLADVAKKAPRVGTAFDLVAGKGVSHVTFDGLAFEGSRRDAIRLEDATNVQIRACRVSLTGAWGVWIQGGARVRVSGCDLVHLGEGGISLVGGDPVRLTPAGHVADNCHIAHYGEVIPSYRAGVSLAGVGQVCTHNLIHHSLHQGVWFNGNDHRIAYNVIHDTCQYNDDAGAIYCCQRDWTKRGTVIEYNMIHQTGKRPYATHDDPIYLDDYSSGITVRGNVIHSGTLGVHVGGGNGNTIVSNLILACETAVNIGSRRGKHFGGVHEKGRRSMLYRKIDQARARLSAPPWSTRYPDLLRLLSFPDLFRVHDPVFNTVAENVFALSGAIQCPLLKDVAPYSSFTNNLVTGGTNVVVDFGAMDFRIRPGSAAWRVVGDLPVGQMGLYASADRLSPPVRFGADVTRTPPSPVQTRAPSVVRIDVSTARLPPGVASLAEADMVRCNLLASQKGRRVYAVMAGVPEEVWKTYSFSFTPACDAVCTLALSGGFGGKTEYAAIRAEGCQVLDGAFEMAKTPWRLATGGDVNGPGDNGLPYGPQKGYAIANHVRQTIQTVRVRKGVRVTITFRARAYVPQGAKGS